MSTKILYTLDQLSQEFEEGGETSTIHGDYVITFKYYKDGNKYLAGIKFNRIRFVSYTTEGVMHLYQVQPSDTIIEVNDSNLLAQINRIIIDRQINYPNPFHHYIIKFDGCHEVIAEGWELLPEEIIE